ncbi:type II secretion system protein GspD [Verrucomicrobiota bacterium sgz303538]
MKALPILFAAIATTCFAQDLPDATPDPTRASGRMKAALLASGSAIPELTVKGLVVGSSREGGTVLLEAPGGARVIARPGVAFNVVSDGSAQKLVIKRISSEGIEIEAPEQKEVVVLPTFGPVRETRGGMPGEVDYVEFRDLPLLDALRMLSDQTGNNYSASVEANKIPVNVMLRNISANAVVEEICKSHGLWFRRDPKSGIMRIMTLAEFEKDLAAFREEQTEVFTLKYPNVSEVSVAIANLFGDRVQLSLGGEETDDDMRRDLQGRFDRFDILSQRTQSSSGLNGNGNIVGNNVDGFYSNGSGVSGFGLFNGNSRYGSNSYRNQYDRRRSDRGGSRTTQVEDDQLRDLTPEQAERIERSIVASRQNGEAAVDIESFRKRPATIYVTASRRNNMVVVRTGDSRAMEDIRALVRRMDVPTPLILLEVKVLSIELGKGFESAFDYQFSDGRFGGSFTSGAINPSVVVDPITGAPTGATSSLPGLGSAGLQDGRFVFQFLGDSVRARLQLLESKNCVNTVATPTLLTANNEVARLFLGEERPIVRGINSQTIITDNNVATTPNTTTEFRAVGNTLFITPNINSDRTVTIRLVQENSFINPGAASIPVVTNGGTAAGAVQNVKVDVVATRSISGTFVAKDGMAVAAGGLIEDVDNDRRAQVPLLGDIPGLGVLFRRQNKEKSRRELVIILRPHVMSTPADGERISREVLEGLAPMSVQRLVEEGILPEMPLIPQPPVAVPVPVPVRVPDPKITTPPKKSRSSR